MLKHFTLKRKKFLFFFMPILLSVALTGCGSSKPAAVTVTIPLNQASQDSKTDQVPEPVPFKIDSKELLKDMQNTIGLNGGINTVDPTTKVPYAFTLGKTGSMAFIEIPNDKIKEFRIENTDTNADIAKVTVYLDVIYSVSKNPLVPDGNYESKGTVLVVYNWTRNTSGKYSWNFNRYDANSSTFKAVKL